MPLGHISNTAPSSKLPNAARPKKGKTSAKKNKAADDSGISKARSKKLAGLPEDEVMKKVFPLSLKGKALAWYRLCDDIGSWNWNRLKLEIHQKNILCI